jgi:4-diphosphocytidyl-2C-methyl-D-erythritol kinase
LSGSGSSLFAVYRSERDRDDARELLGKRHGHVDAVETLAEHAPGPVPITAPPA